MLAHCFAGKDRTGFIVAMVLEAVSVDRKAILTDYLRSNVATPQLRARILEMIQQRSDTELTPEVVTSLRPGCPTKSSVSARSTRPPLGRGSTRPTIAGRLPARLGYQRGRRAAPGRRAARLNSAHLTSNCTHRNGPRLEFKGCSVAAWAASEGSEAPRGTPGCEFSKNNL